MQPQFVSLLGLLLFIAIAWGLSSHRRQFPFRTVLAGIALQFLFAIIILKTRFGAALFRTANSVVNRLNDFANEGSRMVFGPLADPEILARGFGPANAVVLAIVVTGTIIFISALSSLLYHLGILQKIVRAVAFVMQKLMRTSGSESLAAAANIFMGQTEAPLVVRPYVGRMTRSELFALMVGGMATIAGGVAAVYSRLGVDAGFPNMAGHLLTASVIGAPASLMVAKIMIPETEASETAGRATASVESDAVNSVDALCRGAGDGLTLALNVIAMLIGFVALVALANFLIIWPQKELGVTQPVSLQVLLGWINAPFAWFIGIPARDCLLVGQFLGERIVLNEFVGYLSLTQHKEALDPRSFALSVYALCGFANFGSVAIQIGGIGALVPARRADLARLGMRAMVAGLISCYLTAAVVGVLL